MAFSAFSNCANLLRSAAASRSAFSARAWSARFLAANAFSFSAASCWACVLRAAAVRCSAWRWRRSSARRSAASRLAASARWIRSDSSKPLILPSSKVSLIKTNGSPTSSGADSRFGFNTSTGALSSSSPAFCGLFGASASAWRAASSAIATSSLFGSRTTALLGSSAVLTWVWPTGASLNGEFLSSPDVSARPNSIPEATTKPDAKTKRRRLRRLSCS